MSSTVTFGAWAQNKVLLGMKPRAYVKTLNTPFNIVAGLIVLVGLYVTGVRFLGGLGAATHLSDDYPWGLWIGFDVLCGVALAAGGFLISAAVHIFRLDAYRIVIRPAILTGLLGYFFVVVALLYDLGRPWRLPYPMFVSYGVTSVMFLIGWHVALYLTVQFLEFSPATFEWLGWKRFRRWAAAAMLGATIFGVILSTLHQSALGALFLIAPAKVHPLWYSPYLPVLFFISSIAAGLAMVIVESTLSHKVFPQQFNPGDGGRVDRVILGLGKAAAVVLLTYFCLKWLGVAHSNNWHHVNTSYGYWFLVEVFVFVLVPCIFFTSAARTGSVGLARFAAFFTVIGVVLNRLNVAFVAFNWNVPQRYVPSWMEFATTIFIVTLALLSFRWIVNRMPVFGEHPD
jgi:Ni/Fe-hydrogenase subunit HybB-like protein